jgi:hypothetical protein
MWRLRKFLGLSPPKRRLLIEAALLTGVARLAVMLLPFRWIAAWLGRQKEETAAGCDGENQQVLSRLRWAVAAASRHVPWQAKCLVQAMTARSMLKRRSITGTLYLGLAKDPQGKLQAHAWLRSGDTIVAGGVSMRTFTVVSTFAFGPVLRAPQAVTNRVFP